MKKIFFALLAFGLTTSAVAQTFNIKVAGVNYVFPASKTGDMTYQDGTTLTVMDKTFKLSDINGMAVNSDLGKDCVVEVSYNGDSPNVTIQTNQIENDWI